MAFLLSGCISSQKKGTQWQGNGAENNPYQIANVEDLIQMATCINSGSKDYTNANYVLKKDIDLEGVEWIPIGYYHPNFEVSSKALNGSFDGAGHKISNLMISLNLDNMKGKDGESISFGQGFFGCIGENAEVKNLTFENASIFYTGEDTANEITVGCLVGVNQGGTISNCQVTGKIHLISGEKEAGGIVGANYGSVVSCAAICTIEDSIGAEPRSAYIGGIAGINYKLIEDSTFNGSIINSTLDSSKNIGGLIGRNEGEIKDSHTNVSIDVSGGSGIIGGAVGYNQGSMDNCSAVGIVLSKSAPMAVGGLVGASALANEVDGGMISNCKVACKVQALEYIENSPIGCFIGSNGITVENCQCNTELSTVKDFVGVGSDEGIVGSNWSGI